MLTHVCLRCTMTHDVSGGKVGDAGEPGHVCSKAKCLRVFPAKCSDVGTMAGIHVALFTTTYKIGGVAWTIRMYVEIDAVRTCRAQNRELNSPCPLMLAPRTTAG